MSKYVSILLLLFYWANSATVLFTYFLFFFNWDVHQILTTGYQNKVHINIKANEYYYYLPVRTLISSLIYLLLGVFFSLQKIWFAIMERVFIHFFNFRITNESITMHFSLSLTFVRFYL